MNDHDAMTLQMFNCCFSTPVAAVFSCCVYIYGTEASAKDSLSH